MKKLLYTASTARHILDNHMEILEILASEGWDVTVGCRNAAALPPSVKGVEISYAKSFFSPENLRAWRFLRHLYRREAYDAVLTHTALAGFVARMALYPKGKQKTFCLHTVHGYLFGRYATLSGKLTYLFEWMCRGVTDALVTMNKEDCRYARKFVRNGENIFACLGMGVDKQRFFPVDSEEKAKLRRDLDLPKEGFLLFYAAEHSPRKNHRKLLKAMPEICKNVPNAMLILAGDGKLFYKNQKLANYLGIDHSVRFLGYVEDTAPWLKACDAAVSASLSEGLPVGIMEAMCCKIPVIASCVKGNLDLLADCPENLFNPKKSLKIAHCVANFEQHKLPETAVPARPEAAKALCRLYSAAFDKYS